MAVRLVPMNRFRLSLAASLLSFVLSTFAIAIVQTGPSWEVPVAAMSAFLNATRVAIALLGFSIWLYTKLGKTGASVRMAAKVPLLLSIALLIVAYVASPEQWQFRYPLVSGIARRSLLPIAALCLIVFLSLAFIFRGESRFPES